MSYSQIVQEAWTLFWRHKQLWLLGILGAILGQNSVSVNFNYQMRRPIDSVMPEQLSEPLVNTILGADWQVFIPLVVAGALLAVCWGILALILGAWVLGAQIAMVQDALRSGIAGWRASFARGRQRLWPLVGITLVAWLPVLVMMFLLFAALAPLFARIFFAPLQEVGRVPESAYLSLLGPIFCLVPIVICGGVPLLIVLSLLQVLAVRACVIEGMGVRASYSRAWLMLRRNLGYVILTLLAMFVLGAVVSSILAVPALLLWMPLAQTFFEGTRTLTTFFAFVAVSTMFWGISVLLGGTVAAFGSALWTRLYLSFVDRLAAPTGFAPAPPPVDAPAS